jgi:hypothetical protein
LEEDNPRKGRTAYADFLDLGQRRFDIVLNPKRREVGIGREGVDQTLDSFFAERLDIADG